MDKRAQRRDWSHRIREKVDIFGQAAEAFSPTFGALMKNLVETDKEIRGYLSEGGVSLKDVLKQAKSNYNRKEYMAVVSKLDFFHDRIETVVNKLKTLSNTIDEAHEEFIFKDLPDDTMTGLKSLQRKFQTKKAAHKTEIVKNAIFDDLWYALTNDRSKAMRGWEKRYPTKMKILKSETNALLITSNNLFSLLLKSLKEMSAGRAARNLERYIKASEKLIQEYDKYNNAFKAYYDKNIENFLAKLVAKEAERAAEAEKAKETEVTTESPDDSVDSYSPAMTNRNPGSQNYDPQSFSVAPDDAGVSSFSPAPGSQNFDPQSVTDRTKLPYAATMPAQSPNLVSPEIVEELGSGPTTQRSPGWVQHEEAKPQSGPFSVSPNAVREPQTTPRDAALPPALTPRTHQNTLENQILEQNKQNLQAPQLSPDLQQEVAKQVQQQNQQAVTPAPKKPKPKLRAKPAKEAALLSTLEVLSSESPETLALEIYKYAKSIESEDPETSSKLLVITRKILNNK